MQWVCDICGYVHDEDEPPEGCPVCGAPRSKFSEWSEEDDVLGDGEDFLDEDDDGYSGNGDDDKRY
jgi:predicted  nucleic acid-binding Zn-ribbon protein